MTLEELDSDKAGALNDENHLRAICQNLEAFLHENHFGDDRKKYRLDLLTYQVLLNRTIKRKDDINAAREQFKTTVAPNSPTQSPTTTKEL